MEEERKMHLCLLCKHRWLSKLDHPRECPRCKRYDWKGFDIEDKEEEDVDN